MAKLRQLLGSRKFWASAVSVVVAVVGTRAGIPEEALVAAVATIIAYILGTALEDGLRNGPGPR